MVTFDKMAFFKKEDEKNKMRKVKAKCLWYKIASVNDLQTHLHYEDRLKALLVNNKGPHSEEYKKVYREHNAFLVKMHKKKLKNRKKDCIDQILELEEVSMLYPSINHVSENDEGSIKMHEDSRKALGFSHPWEARPKIRAGRRRSFRIARVNRLATLRRKSSKF